MLNIFSIICITTLTQAYALYYTGNYERNDSEETCDEISTVKVQDGLSECVKRCTVEARCMAIKSAQQTCDLCLIHICVPQVNGVTFRADSESTMYSGFSAEMQAGRQVHWEFYIDFGLCIELN